MERFKSRLQFWRSKESKSQENIVHPLWKGAPGVTKYSTKNNDQSRSNQPKNEPIELEINPYEVKPLSRKELEKTKKELELARMNPKETSMDD